MSDHILVADNDPKQADLVRLYLERDGFEVTVAYDGREALHSAQLFFIYLIVL